MLKVAVTGGIGSGKSTVAAALGRLGAVVIDADALAREALAPHTAALAEVVRLFGADLLRPDGSLDREKLGSIVFADAAARQQLENIVHPIVQERSAALMAAASADSIAVYDVPLLAEIGRAGEFDVVVVVEASDATRVQRLQARGLTETDARRRMAAQASDGQRRAVAHAVLTNDGDIEALQGQVRDLWTRLRSQVAAASVPPPVRRQSSRPSWGSR